MIFQRNISQIHLLDIYYRDDIRIEAVVDKDPAAAESAARAAARHAGKERAPAG